jgi:hypothetical protein
MAKYIFNPINKKKPSGKANRLADILDSFPLSKVVPEIGSWPPKGNEVW